MDKNFLAAVSTVVGTLVGGGILALPYAMSKSGFFYGLLMLFIVAIASILITLYTAELSLRAKKMHQLPILIGDSLGKRFRIFVLILQVVTILGALIAYFIGLSSAISILFGIPYYLSLFILFVLSFPLVLKGFDIVEKSETPLFFVKVLILIIASVVVLHYFNFSNIMSSNLLQIFSPFGVILFSLTAYTVIPEVKQEVAGNVGKLVKVILVSFIISILIYLLFSLSFLGAFGAKVSQIATNYIASGYLKVLLLLTTIFMLITPLLALGLVMADTFYYDFKVNRWISTVIAVLIPAVIATFNIGFESVVDIIGGVFLSLLSLSVIFAVYVSRKKEGISRTYSVFGGNYTLLFTGIIMVLGLVYTILNVI
ncbi:MAG: aromatic amino acid transport family protein [Candidatus Parvarchaeota archaeon]